MLCAQPVKIYNFQRDARLPGDCQQVEHSIRRSTRCRNRHDGVLQRLAGQNLAGGAAGREHIHHQAAYFKSPIILASIHRRDAGAPHRRYPQKLAGRGHRVGGELAAAGASTWAGRIFKSLKRLGGHPAGRMGPHGFEDVLDGDIRPFKAPWTDRAAVQHQAGDIQPGERHDRAGDGLVASGEGDQRIELVPAGDQLD